MHEIQQYGTRFVKVAQLTIEKQFTKFCKR